MISDLANSLPNWAAAGGGAGATLFALKLLFDFISGRLDKREAASLASAQRLDAATYKLIENLEKRLDALTERLAKVEGELIECRAQHAQCERELARLQAIVQGFGDAKQVAQTALSADRVMDRNVAKIVGKVTEQKG